MPRSIASVTPTICALLGIAAPELALSAPLAEVLDVLGTHAGSAAPLQRILLFAPDALGCHLHGPHAEQFARVRDIAPLEVPLRSVVPPVTPVCFASMFTGAPPAVHGITHYERPRLECDTVFDALLRAGLSVAIVAVKDCSVDIIFRGRELDYFSEPRDSEVEARALQLIEAGRHDFIVAYQQEYDDCLHRTTPLSADCATALLHHVDSFAKLFAATEQHWAQYRRAVAFTPDHGAHIDPASGHGTHGEDIPADMEVSHFWRVSV